MTLVELSVLMGQEAEQHFESSINCDGRLVFSRPGLRIFELPDGSLRSFEAAGYNGPSAQRYLEALAENQLEAALVDSYLTMTPEGRRQRAAQGERIADKMNPDLRTAPFQEPRTVEQVSNGSARPRARWPTPPRRPTTRTTRSR
jgi:hypothetical protein